MIDAITSKTILITGGTGSFGRAFIKKVLIDHAPEKVIVLSRDEWKQWEMRDADPVFADPRMRYFLGDVRDVDRLRRAFAEVDVVIHAAALKQVPAAEYNPCEFIKTNVLGAMNVIDAAIDCGVERVIALSTDKAASPVNLYGATKLCADKLMVAANVYAGKRGLPRFSVVRYGNVLASRGSAVSYWQALLEKGGAEIPITDERMTRFWMTLDQAVAFVLSSLEQMEGGEVFVPKIPSMKLTDLAEAVAPGVPRKIVGIRPGEKLHEVLFAAEESHKAWELPDRYVVCDRKVGEALPDGFVYSSDTNKRWLSIDELKTVLGG